MIIPKNSYAEIKIADILTIGTDLIVKYKLDNDDTIRTIPVLMKHLSRFLENNLCNNLMDLIKYYISKKEEISILKICKFEHHQFNIEDFVIQEKNRRDYGKTTLVYVKIYNTKTGVFLEDWVSQYQIGSIKEINNLICWETDGEEIDFY